MSHQFTSEKLAYNFRHNTVNSEHIQAKNVNKKL